MLGVLHRLFMQRAWWVVATLLLFVLLLHHASRPAPPGLCVLGDARVLHAAAIPPGLAKAEFDAHPVRAGFGVATTSAWSRLGEALIVDGVLYTRPTDPQARDYYRLDSNRYFRTSAFAALPADAVTRDRIVLRAGQRFDDLWRALGTQFPDGVIAMGLVHFDRLQTLALSRPPTLGLPIYSSSALYYTEPMETRAPAVALVAGLAAHRDVLRARSGDDLFARLVARRPDGRPDLYAQALVLDVPALTGWSQLPRPLPARAVGRIAASSVIARGELLLFPASQLSDCPSLHAGEH